MSTPADKLPTWGTKTTVDTGPDTGLTTRLEPSAADKANGYIADQDIAARVDNWLKGVTLDWLAYLAPIQLRNWQKLLGPVKHTSWAAPQVQPTAIEVPSGWLIGGGQNVLADDKALLLQLPGGTVSTSTGPELVSTAWRGLTGYAGVISIAHNPGSGQVMLGVARNSGAANTAVIASDEGLSSFTPVELSTSAERAGRVVFESTSGRFIAFGHGQDWQTGKHYWTSTNGSTWTQHTISGQATAYPVTILYAALGLVALGSAGRTGVVWVSSDGGDNWVLETVTGSSSGVVGIAHTSEGLCVQDFTGKVFRRLSNGTWQSIADLGSDCIAGYLTHVSYWESGFSVNTLAGDGGRSLVSSFALSGRGFGVRYSMDHGLTWSDVWLNQNSADTTKNAVHGVAGGQRGFLAVFERPDASGASRQYEIYQSLRL